MGKGGGAGGIGENKLIVPQINQSVVIPAPANIVLTIFFYQKTKRKNPRIRKRDRINLLRMRLVYHK